MRIGIIGTGNMGRTLGVAWALHGHEVFFGARDLGKAQEVASYAGAAAQSGSNEEAARFADIAVWNPRVFNASEVLSDPLILAGKPVIDMNDGPIPGDFKFPHQSVSFAERLAASLPGALVVKAFNTIAQEAFEHTPETIQEHGVSVFLAGDHASAKASVAALATQLGFVAVDVGGLERAGMLESLADFIRYMMIAMGRGMFATVSVSNLPELAKRQFGGRLPTKLT